MSVPPILCRRVCAWWAKRVIGRVLTSDTHGSTGEEATDGVVPVVILFTQVSGGATGKLEGDAGGSW